MWNQIPNPPMPPMMMTQEGLNQWSLEQSSIYMNMPVDQVDWASLAKQWTNMQQAMAVPHLEPQFHAYVPFSVAMGPVNHFQTNVPPLMMPPAHLPPPLPPMYAFSQTPTMMFQSPPLHSFTPQPPPPLLSTDFSQPPPFIPSSNSKAHVSALPPPNRQLDEDVVKAAATDLDLRGAEPISKVVEIKVIEPIIEEKKEVEEEEEKQLDEAKKNKLPTWIREGLERMERERQKQKEKEDKIRQKQKEEEFRRELEKEELEEEEIKTTRLGDQKLLNGNTKVEDDKRKMYKSLASNDKTFMDKVIVLSKIEQIYKNEEERENELMWRVRKSLTEILLEVTDKIIRQTASKCLYEASLAKVTAVSKKLAASAPIIKSSGLGGIVSYGSDSESDNDQKGDNSSHDQSVANIEIVEKSIKSQKRIRDRSRSRSRSKDKRHSSKRSRSKSRSRRSQSKDRKECSERKEDHHSSANKNSSRKSLHNKERHSSSHKNYSKTENKNRTHRSSRDNHKDRSRTSYSVSKHSSNSSSSSRYDRRLDTKDNRCK